jgi:hypothetical protein
MPADLATMVGAVPTLTLGGRTLFLSQLTLGDIGTVEAWLKERVKRPFQVAKEALDDLAGLSPEAYREAEKVLLMAAHADAKAGKISIHSQEALAHLASVEGISLIVWLSARNMHPKLEYDEVAGWMKKEPASSFQAKVQRMIDLLKSSVAPAEETAINPTMPALEPVTMQDIQIGPRSTGH